MLNYYFSLIEHIYHNLKMNNQIKYNIKPLLIDDINLLVCIIFYQLYFALILNVSNFIRLDLIYYLNYWLNVLIYFLN